MFKKYLTIKTLLFCSIAAFSQSPHFELLKAIKNKNDVQVNTIFQDKSSFIWIGTNQGLVKYNGIEFNSFTTNNNLANNEITAIAEDSLGTLWVGHKNGLISIFENGTITPFKPEEGLSNAEISSFLVTKSNSVWFTTLGEGVYYWGGKNRKRIYNINTDDGLLDNYTYSIVQGEGSNFYIATDKGISVFDSIQDKIVDSLTMIDGLPDNIVKHLYFINGVLWIAMEDGGICRYYPKSKEFKIVPHWMFGSINNFIAINKNEIWISTKRNGIIRVTFDEFEQPWYKAYEKKQGLLNNQTKTVFLDKEFNIWIGFKDGLMLKKNNHLEFLDNEDGFDVKNIYNLTFDKTGNLWVASQQGLFMVNFSEMGKISTKKILDNPKFSFLSFLSVYCDTEGFIWAGTYGDGAYRINPNDLSYKIFTTKDGLANNNIISINGKDDLILFSTLGGGVSSYSTIPHRFVKNYSIDNGLASNYIYSSFIDSKNRLWFGTDGGGVSCLSDGVFQKCQDEKDSLFSQDFYSITEDKKGEIWLTSKDKGIYIYNGSTFNIINELNGLRTNEIRSVIRTVNGKIALASNEGIDLYNPDDNSFESWGEEDRVAYLEPSLNAISCNSKGSIWIGTQNGIVVLNPIKDSTKLQKPDLQITSKLLYSKPIPKEKTKFKYYENYLTFHFIGLWYKAPGKLLYRYRLEGADMDWSPATRTLQANYSNLRSGDYRFVVQVSNSPGKWVDSPNASYSFTIKPPFYFTWWFITSLILLILFGVYSFIKYRTAKLERDKDILEEEVRKRTREIQMQKEEIETQRDEIEAQHHYVSMQRDQIANQNRDIKASIEYASRIQQAMLPSVELISENFDEHFIFFNPKDIVSGDFYYFNQHNNKIIMAAADCTGHGVPGAIMSMLGLTLLNDVVNDLDNLSAGKILNELRIRIKDSLKQKRFDGESRDGMDISLCIYDPSSRTINYSGANNALYIVRNSELIVYNPDKMPIGVFIKEEDFSDQQIELEGNDMIYLFSDGYQDQLGGPRNTKFLIKNFKNLLVEISDKPAEMQKQMLTDQMDNWKGGFPQTDDMLVIGIRV